jgi:MFS-type transporter involved in bile tolerance (Atg22 family)
MQRNNNNKKWKQTKMGDGALYMSNIFLSTSFIVLAKRDAGCDPEAEEECDLKVFGFKPTSLIMIIATLSSVLAIVFLPIIGAIVDYTPYRRALGITSAVLTIIVQAIQIGTVEETWFFMSLLQVVNSLNASAHALASWSYIPEIADDVGEEVMATYIPQFNMFMFGHQLGFLMLIISLGIKFGLDDAQIAQMSQGVSVLVSGMYYALAWYFFTGKGARHVLPEGKTLAWAGFEQVVQTIRGIFKYYHSTLGLYFISIVFAESGTWT